MQYLLDSDTCIFGLRDHPNVMAKLMKLPLRAWGISSLTAFELERGLAAGLRPDVSNQAAAFIQTAEVLDFGAKEAKIAAQIENHLKNIGKLSGVLDALIAAHALSLDLTLVTNNTKHFKDVPGLKLENWV